MMNKEVIIAVRGGIATVVKQPDGVDVHIRDYDYVECCDEDDAIDVFEDEDGIRYVFACNCCS